MSTLKVDALQAKTTNGTLTLTNNGSGKVELPSDATIGGVAMTTTFASGATTAEKSNIMLNSFRIEEQGGLTVQGMVDGVSDVFTDESGVDTATSTDESYNATGDYYENAGGADTGSSATTYTSILDADHGSENLANVSLRQVIPNAQISTNGTFVRVQIVAPATGTFIGDNISIVPRSGSTADGTTTPTELLFSGLSGVTVAGGSTTWSDWTEFTVDETADHLVIIDYNGSNNDVRYKESTGTSYTKTTTDSYATAAVAGFSTTTRTWSVGNIEVAPTLAVANSVIVSETFTALSQPDTAFAAIWHEDVDACTPNTDFTVEASRDAGTTWTAGTLALGATLGAAEILTCSIDISAQPAGTSMVWRVKFLNTLSQRLRGVALQWS